MLKIPKKPKWFLRLLAIWHPLLRTWYKYLRYTTIPGLQSVHNAQGKFATFAWSCLFVIGLACTVREVYFSWIDYLAYPVTTAMNLRQATSLPFPAVTVCNLNRVHCGNLRKLARRNRGTDLGNELQRLYEVTSCTEIRKKPKTDFVRNSRIVANTLDKMKDAAKVNEPSGSGKKCSKDSTRGDDDCDRIPSKSKAQKYESGYRIYGHTFGSRESSNDDNYYQEYLAFQNDEKWRSDNSYKLNNYHRKVRREVSRTSKTAKPKVRVTTEASNDAVTVSNEEEENILVNQTRSFNDLMNFMALYVNFSEEHRSAIGHSAEGFIRACTFSGKSCNNLTLFFKPTLSTTFGNCFTFVTARRTVIPGKDYGLSMELFLDQPNYIGGGLSPRAGARVVVHPSSQKPLPDENGVTVPPNTATSIALIQVEITREKLPYDTNCTSGWDTTWYGKRVGASYKYTMERCQRVCLQIAFEEACSCTHPSYMDLPTEAFPCNLTSDHQDYTCASQVLDEFESSVRTCSCNMDCKETSYSVKISQAAWPDDNNWCNVAQNFGMARNCKEEAYQSEYRVREKQHLLQNVLTIDVFFESLRISTIDQHPTYKLQTFVGSLGGVLSLYLGVTLFMLLEVVEVFFRLVLALCQFTCRLFYQRGSTSMQRKKLRRAHKQNGIYYTNTPEDFRTGASHLPSGPKPMRPMKFAW